MSLLCPVAPAGLEFSSREEGHGAETRAAETKGEGWGFRWEADAPEALLFTHKSILGGGSLVV